MKLTRSDILGKLEYQNKLCDSIMNQLEVVRWTIYQADKRHNECLSMVSIPNQRYKDEWDNELHRMESYLSSCTVLEDNLQRQLSETCCIIAKLESMLKGAKDND